MLPLQFGQKCNFLAVDGSINLKFDVSVTVTALGLYSRTFSTVKKLHTGCRNTKDDVYLTLGINLRAGLFILSHKGVQIDTSKLV